MSSKRLYAAKEAAQQLSLGLTTTRALIASGALRSITIGVSRRIPAEALDEYISRVSAQQNGR